MDIRIECSVCVHVFIHVCVYMCVNLYVVFDEKSVWFLPEQREKRIRKSRSREGRRKRLGKNSEESFRRWKMVLQEQTANMQNYDVLSGEMCTNVLLLCTMCKMKYIQLSSLTLHPTINAWHTYSAHFMFMYLLLKKLFVFSFHRIYFFYLFNFWCASVIHSVHTVCSSNIYWIDQVEIM